MNFSIFLYQKFITQNKNNLNYNIDNKKKKKNNNLQKIRIPYDI